MLLKKLKKRQNCLKENFNAFKKVENWRHEKYKSSKVCKKDKQPSYPYTDQQLQHVDHLVDNKFMKDIPASAEYLIFVRFE